MHVPDVDFLWHYENNAKRVQRLNANATDWLDWSIDVNINMPNWNKK